ncbi:hypothetical protein BDQ12DRAFT_662349 [Crucibulum laeve]|uniref:HMG box domain-containing protein n=1 Tax=Crucibulum laeve TaxID=68775 RepID=A0A5C3MEC9_9AGAR|nr:hypothetical protein BDQ12DRAFT_662349 [Crucibulum laeve]
MTAPYSTDAPMKDATPLLGFDDSGHFTSSDSDQMIFGPLEFDDGPILHSSSPNFHWDPFTDVDTDVKPVYGCSSLSPTHYEFTNSQISPSSSYYDSGVYSPDDLHSSPTLEDNLYLANWINDPDIASIPSPSSPITIPSSADIQQSSFVAYNEHGHFPTDGAFSPTSFAALHPLPRSISPPSSFDDGRPLRQRVNSISPRDSSLHTPSWASQLWDTPSSLRTPTLVRPSVRHSPLSDTTLRQRIPIRRGSLSSGNLFQSSSAPSQSELPRAPSMARSFSRRAESVSVSDDRDATVRRKKRLPNAEDPPTTDKASDPLPMKSLLRPPKLAPSAWQLYFTDWIQKQQLSGTRKLNVAQAAKEAGQEYACLSTAEKEPYKRRSQEAKDARERELNAYMRTLTPDDIKRENAFRTAQRKAGKSRKSNIKDPNAPKKPLSAYFMFLQRIRASQQLVREIFGDETETTKQSVLAAAKWRSMTDAERQPFLAQAEQEKMEYEAARRLYEEGTTAFGTSINFSILPGSPAFPSIKLESESESEGFMTDDGFERPIRS